jgi:Chaperone of endosialidase
MVNTTGSNMLTRSSLTYVHRGAGGFHGGGFHGARRGFHGGRGGFHGGRGRFHGGRGGFHGGRGGGRGGRRSDFRLKHDITLLGRLDNGLGLYRFIYNGGKTAYVGVISQEVQKVVPQAVTRGSDGYLRVFYDKLGVKFDTYDHWIATGAQFPALIWTWTQTQTQ